MTRDDGLYTGGSLRSDSLRMMHTSVAYLDVNIFRLLRTYPWSVTQGDVADAIRRLGIHPIDELDHVSLKIRSCSIVFPAETEKAVSLLKDANCGIGLVEKTHRHGKILKKYHPCFSAEQLATRALVCYAKLMFRPTVEDKQRLKLQILFGAIKDPMFGMSPQRIY